MSRFSRIINVEDLKIGALENVPQKSISANFVAKTFIYTGDEAALPGAQTQPAGTPGSPQAPAPAASSARKLKERAEGRGVE
jgi:hypothetical protein